MQTTDQIIHAKWIITGEIQNQPLENQALIIQEGKIKEILPSKSATERYNAKTVQHFSSHAILPGFINTHTHLAMNYFRGLADDLALMDWLHNHIWPAERQWVSAEFVRDASLFAMAEMIRSGTTCFNDMYFFLQDTAKAAEIAGIRAFIGMTIINFPTAWAKNAEEYFAKGLEFMHEYKNHPFVTPTIAPHAPYTVTDEILLKVKEIAEQYNLKINMHIHETSDEINQSLTQYKMRPLKRLQKLGFVSPRLIAIHMTQVDDEDLEIITAERPQIVHCPESNMKLASGICPVSKLDSLDINVALGTDSSASNNDLDMISEMRSAALLAKLSTRDPTTLSASHTITMATLKGAKALGIDQITGSITAGKSADFIAINLDEIETLPLYHPVSQVVYAASRNQVTDVWVAGKQLMKNRQLLTLNEEELKEKARYWQTKLDK